MIEFGAHTRVLRALSREHKNDRRFPELLVAREDAIGIACFQRGSAVGGILTNHNATVTELAPAHLQCESGVRQFPRRLGDIGIAGDLPQMPRQIRRRPIQRINCFGGQHQQLTGTRWSRRRQIRRLLENNVRVGASHPEGTHARPERNAGLGLPFLKSGIDIERAVFDIEPRVRLREMKTRRNCLVVKGECRLDETGHASRGVQVTDVRLDRTNRAKLFGVCSQTERFRQCCHFDRVAQRSGCAMGLNVGDRFRIDPGERVRHGDDFRLALDTGSAKTNALRSIIV